MKVKVIGIGNRIMRDDAIGVLLAESLKGSLKKLGIQVIVGETDIDYCVSLIEEGDILFIIDATLYGIDVGDLTIIHIDENAYNFERGYSQHQLSLVKLLHSYSMKNISGYIIGIEVASIGFDTNLSLEIEKKFSEIRNKVYNFIISKGGVHYA